jgi:1-acyl-sn-glycerol-3-phosphate acyltransferase
LEPVWDALSQGDSLILFPEGSRNREEGIGPFKPGLFHINERFPGVEMVPVHLSNLNRVMPKGECLPVPMICRVTMAAPFAAVKDEDKSDFLERAREAVVILGEKNDH